MEDERAAETPEQRLTRRTVSSVGNPGPNAQSGDDAGLFHGFTVVVSSADIFVLRGLRWMVEHQAGNKPSEVRVTEATTLTEVVASVTKIRPKVIVVDMGRTPAQCFAHLPALTRYSGVVLISRRHDANFAQLARRQGAAEILVYDKSSDLQVVRAVQIAAASTSSAGKIVSTSSPSPSYARNSTGTLPNLPNLPNLPRRASGAQHISGARAPRLHLVGDPPGGTAGVRVTLSQRESQVMDLVAGGQTNGEVAAALGLTEKTVKNHINRIFSKLNVQTRVQAVLAWKSGTDR
ncbi:response regulator transcription factor [Streptomyces sp. CA-250714]|uniref:helix-turn-helix transcriptional regulator n=1 Tax=Streptomyces sp. CA-250714 TaxID=3240060 RepID=UPI003D930A93